MVIIRFIILICILIFSSHSFANLYECEMKPKNINATYWVSAKDKMKVYGNFKGIDLPVYIFYEFLNNEWTIKGFNVDERKLQIIQDNELSIFKKDIIEGKVSDKSLVKAWGLKITIPNQYKTYFKEINKLSKKERINFFNENISGVEPMSKEINKLIDDWEDITFTSSKKNTNTTKLSLKEGTTEIIGNISNSYKTEKKFLADLRFKGISGDTDYDFLMQGKCELVSNTYIAKNNTDSNNSKNKKTHKNQNVNVKKDNEGPIITVNKTFEANNDLTALVNGKITDESKIVSITIDGDEVALTNGVFSKKLYVKPKGQNINIVAIDKHGNITKKTVKLMRSTLVAEENIFDFLDPRKIKSKTNDNSVALIIGVEEYENTFSAPFAANDALVFNDFARLSLGIPYNNIKLLTNDDAGRNDTIKALKSWLPKKIIENETELFIFYSGHGLASEDGSDLYLLPADGDPEILEDTTLLRNNIFEIIKDLNPKTVTMFLDTCYSGATRSDELLVASRPIFIEAEEQNIPVNFNIFSAASGKQTAKVLKEAEHGLFSYFMMKGLEGEADANKDRTITNGELHAFINKNVSRQANQTPQLNGDPEQVLVQW